MPVCNECKREFSSEEGLAQHMRDKHGIGKVTTHDKKQQKREEKIKQQKAEQPKISKKSRDLLFYSLIVLIIAAAVYYFATSAATKNNGANNSAYDLSGIPSGSIHWHFQVQTFICGERKLLPEPAVGGEIGSSLLHTHDRDTNIQSMPGTDGNGVGHIEGNIISQPQEATLGRFMEVIGINFGNETIMDKKNGDLCGDKPGQLNISLNGRHLNNFMNYIPRDGDTIKIEFS